MSRQKVHYLYYLVLHKTLTMYPSTHGIMACVLLLVAICECFSWSLYLPRSATFFFFVCLYIRKSSSCGWIAESHMSESEQLFIGLAPLLVTYIFTAPTCRITIISHELCALNAEI